MSEYLPDIRRGVEEIREILARAIRANDPSPEYYRPDNEMICEACDMPYWRHPYDPAHIDENGNPFLRMLCNGDLIKL